MKKDYFDMTEEEKDAEYEKNLRKSKNISDRMKVDYFFNEGPLGRYMKNSEEIGKLIDTGKARTGAYIAHCRSWFVEDFKAKAMMKRVNRREFNVLSRCIETECKHQEEFIQELTVKYLIAILTSQDVKEI